MTVTIEVAPHVQRRLEAKARRGGQTLDAYVSRVVERDALALEPIEEAAAQLSSAQKAEIARKLAALDALTAQAREYSQGKAAPDEWTFSREAAYQEAG